jgi:hypothetical protein
MVKDPEWKKFTAKLAKRRKKTKNGMKQTRKKDADEVRSKNCII